jgi:hypothetical protein
VATARPAGYADWSYASSSVNLESLVDEPVDSRQLLLIRTGDGNHCNLVMRC